MTTTLLRAALDALVYHTDQTRPIHSTQMTIDAIRAHLAAQPAPVPTLIRTFNAGYMLGHHDTVEGVFTDIHSSDMDTYHADEVAEFFGQSAAPVPAKCDGGTCGLGGYCDNCPKQAAAPVPVPLTDQKRGDLVMEHLGPLALTGGKLSIYDAFLLGIDAAQQAHGIATPPEVPHVR